MRITTVALQRIHGKIRFSSCKNLAGATRRQEWKRRCKSKDDRACVQCVR